MAWMEAGTRAWGWLVVVAVGLGACEGSDPPSLDDGASTGAAASTGDTGPGATGQDGLDSTAGPEETMGPPLPPDVAVDTDLPPPVTIDCRDEPPAGATQAAPLPVYEGTCPELVPGFNTIDSNGNAREFLLVTPLDLDPAERLPVVFLWHWLGGTAEDFLAEGDVQNAVDQFRFVAVIPEAKGDLTFRWPFTLLDPPARFEEEYRFFDDMLACVGEQYAVEPNCVSTAGVSAGGLFIPHLAAARGGNLASFMSLSGGTGGEILQPWQGSSHVMPAMVLWGGDNDFCVAVDFNNVSRDMEQGLADDGHFILECIHNCGHAVPPFEVAEGETAFAPMWKFVTAHPYWLEDGQSPYSVGVPSDMPDWCGVGMGGATPREGECGPSAC